MNIEKDKDLQALNTLNLPCIAEFYVAITQTDHIPTAVSFAQQQQRNMMLLSGGSNILLPQRLQAVVVHVQIQGIEQLQQDENSVLLKVGAGENWHEFVCYSTAHGLYGLQNLALIPGLVGASPVQNIGAYGVEVGEFIEWVDVYDREQQCFTQLSAMACQFGYRDSIFKQQPSRYIICAVQFRLRKHAQLKIQYGDLKQAMANDLTPENLQRQVIAIRQSKLPDPKQFPNVGSFFKNPVISQVQYDALASQFPNMPHYVQDGQRVKLAAGWLIEQAGWKGKRLGAVGMFAKQALVLVNYANATIDDVRQTYATVQADVYHKFAVELESEPVQFSHDGLILSKGHYTQC